MQTVNLRKRLFAIPLVVAILWFAGTTQFSSCKVPPSSPTGDSLKVLLDWNLFFQPSYDSTGRDTVRQAYEAWINHYIDSIKPGAFRSIRWKFCPCDSALANVFVQVGTAGGTIPNPPPVPKPGPTGDYALLANINFSLPPAAREGKPDSMKIPFRHPLADTTVLAVIDTGLDTVALKGGPLTIIWANNMLWTEENGKALFDVMPADATTTLNDENDVKHGTAATALAMKQFENRPSPRIMTIKAFDKEGKGSIYTVSCAMSYAIQKKVTAINASWGYEAAESDEVLAHYFELANQNNIAVFAAAGNDTEAPHNPPYDGTVVINRMKLEGRHLFFPACLSDRLHNLITVTGVNNPGNSDRIIPCTYQHYSDVFVNLGVLNKEQCCVYNLASLPSQIEGSSFATPIATGQIMQIFTPARPGMAFNLQDTVTRKVDHYNAPFYTRNGNVIRVKNQR